MKAKFRKTANVDYQEAVAWYRHKDPELAARFAAEVSRTVARIEESPAI